MEAQAKQNYFVKHKKAIAIGGGIAIILGTTGYFVFIHKDKDGNTLFGRLRNKNKPSDDGKVNLGDLKVKEGGSVSINPAIIQRACNAIPSLTHDELISRLQYTGAPTSDDALRILLKQKIGCQ